MPADCKKGAPNTHGDVYWCDACTFGAVLPTPSPEEVAGFYRLDHYYTQGESHFEPEGERSLLDRLRVHLAWRLDRGRPVDARAVHEALLGRPSRIIDLGCGGGQLLFDLSKLGHDVVGVEVDPRAISRNYEGKFPVYAGTAEVLPEALSGEKFDCVVMCHVLEHCRDPLRALANARSLLKPDGKFVCEVPNNQAAALDQVGCSWEMFDVPRHLYFFTSASLARACALCGLTVKQTTYGHYVRQFTNAWINTERKLFRNVMSIAPAPFPPPVENSRRFAWQLLAKTFAAPPERKYDSIGIVAVPV